METESNTDREISCLKKELWADCVALSGRVKSLSLFYWQWRETES